VTNLESTPAPSRRTKASTEKTSGNQPDARSNNNTIQRAMSKAESVSTRSVRAPGSTVSRSASVAKSSVNTSSKDKGKRR
jgi:hypothetical protein